MPSTFIPPELVTNWNIPIGTERLCLTVSCTLGDYLGFHKPNGSLVREWNVDGVFLHVVWMVGDTDVLN